MAIFYAPGRAGGRAEGSEGKLHMDGYPGYNVVAVPGKGVVRCFCWAHARRKLCEINDSHRSPVAAEGLRRTAAMHTIEKATRGEKLAYIANHWDGLQVFLTDGRVEMDNNAVRRPRRRHRSLGPHRQSH